MATAGDLISGSLRLIGAIAEGETPSGTLMSDSLAAFNTMLDAWSTERLSVFSTQDQVLTWPANQVSRTLGPTGQLVGLRPVLLDDSTYFKVNGISYRLWPINQDQYNAIALKTSTSTLPQWLWINPTMPDATVYLYPVPTQDLEMHFVSVKVLDQPALWSTALSYPPGYERALKYNFACEIAPEFGRDPPRSVARIADVSKRSLKRINNPNDIMAVPYPLVRGTPAFNIYAGDQ